MQFFIYDFMFTKTFFLYILIYFRYTIPQIFSLTLCYRVISKSIKTHLCNKSFKMLTYDSCMPFHRNSREFLKKISVPEVSLAKRICVQIFRIRNQTLLYVRIRYACYIHIWIVHKQKFQSFITTKDWSILPHQCGRVNERSEEGLGGS